MNVFAAVMTGQGTGAISTIELFGDSAQAIISKIFKPESGKSADFKTGNILLGKITDGPETIDQVTIGCEAQSEFAINCHGNPLIVEMIMELLQRHGARLISAEQLLAKTLAAQEDLNTIAIEAKLAQVKAETVEGTKIVLNQIEGGLSKRAAEWLEKIDTISFDIVTAEAARILSDSQTAKLIVAGGTAVITGPPNSGKSTLLNYLCGRQKAIVTDIRGTTRDWVSGRCKTGPLSVELIDTAGLDERLGAMPGSAVDRASQQKAVEILEKADLVLLVLDNSEPAGLLDDGLLEKIRSKKVLTILNKCDLPVRLDTSNLPRFLPDPMLISAKLGTGTENLLRKIPEILNAANFDLKSAVCVTCRQENLLRKLQKAKSRQQAASVITELLNGRLNV